MKILVTGATGFLGTPLCQKLRQAGHSVTPVGSKNADLRQPGSLHKFNHMQFDQIFHLAAWTQAGDFCLRHPGEQWIFNQQMNTNMLGWWQHFQPQAKLIAIGTSCCYEPGKPHREDRYLSGAPTDSLFTYAYTKRMLYVGLLALQKQFGLKYLFLIPNTLYGPDYHLDGRQMHFIFDLLRKIVDGQQKGTPVVLWGDGHQRRELVYVEDFVRAAMTLAENHDNDIVNIGSGEEHSIRWYAEQLSRLVGFDSDRIQYDTSRYVGAESKVLCIDKIRQLLPDFSPTETKQGLQTIVDWYLRRQAA
jgi:GDP-L-fucose synthase